MSKAEGLIKKNLLAMEGYQVPQNLDLIKLNQNESPYDLPPAIKTEIYQRMDRIPWNRYPVGVAESLSSKLARYAACAVENILIGNASNEMIQTLIHATCDSGDSIVVVRPTFAVYKRVADVMNIHTIEVPLNPDFTFDIDRICQQIRHARLVILASPNNPTGTVVSPAQIKIIAQSFPGIIAIDEAYFEFHRQTALGMLEQHPNIVLLRTFSKAMNLAGARLGYMLAHPDIIRECAKCKLPFSLGIFQQAAGEVLLDHIAWIEENISRNLRERERLERELTNLPELRFVSSRANFMLFGSSRITATDLYQALLKEGILVRSYAIPELKDWLRFSLGTPAENDSLLAALNKILRK